MTAAGDSTHSTLPTLSVKEFSSKYIDSVIVFSHTKILLHCSDVWIPKQKKIKTSVWDWKPNWIEPKKRNPNWCSPKGL